MSWLYTFHLCIKSILILNELPMLNNFDFYIQSISIHFSQKNIKGPWWIVTLKKILLSKYNFFFLFYSVQRPIQVKIFLEISERKQRTFANSMDRRLWDPLACRDSLSWSTIAISNQSFNLPTAIGYPLRV